MGQYYKAVLIREDKTIIAWLEPWSFDNGAKLMEHSWLGNNFLNAVENLLLDNPTRLVWCGDYADADTDLGIDEENINAHNDGTMNFYDLCGYKGNVHKEVKEGGKMLTKRAKYIINHSTKEFVNKTKVPLTDTYTDDKGKVYEYRIHPLSLMTCNSNGRGGGDFRREDPNNLIGKWVADEISISTRKPRGFKEILFDLKE